MKIWRMLAVGAFVCGLGLLPGDVVRAQEAPPGVDHPSQGGQVGGVFDLCGAGVGESGILVYIPGRSFVARIGPQGGFTLNYVPAGLWTLVFERNGNVIHTVSDVSVGIRETTDLGIIAICPDQDGDGFDLAADCDDLNPNVFPGATEVCNGVDDDCDGVVDEGCIECTDSDSDGFFAQDGCGTAVDCNDSDPAINPGAVEACFDGIDNNCDGQIDEGCPACEEGTACDTTLPGPCGPGTCVSGNCVPDFSPSPEVCDGIDNDCDGVVDGAGVCDCPAGQVDCGGVCVDLLTNADNCGTCGNACGVGASCVSGVCEACTDIDGDGFCVETGDCDDTNLSVFPGAPEICDGLDNDCNGVIDDGIVCNG